MTTETDRFTRNSSSVMQATHIREIPEDDVISEEFELAGEALVGKVKEWIHQGNVRRIILKNEEGRPLIELPLTVGVIGTATVAAVSPEIVAVGVIGAMVARITVVIERQKTARN